MNNKLRYFLVGLGIGSLGVYLALMPVAEPEEKTDVSPVELASNNTRITGYDFSKDIRIFDEEVPVVRPDIMERLDREIQVNAFWHSNTILTIKRANKWLPVIDSILKANDIPSDFKYLSVIESGLQNVVSPKKAVGFWQFLKGTGKEYGLQVNSKVDERYDPIQSTLAACKYLRDGYNKFGNWTLVAASYNMGMTGINNALTKQKVDSYYDLKLSEEPGRYVFRLIALREILSDPERYGFFIPSNALYTQEPTKAVEVDQSIGNLVAYAQKHGTNYQTLKRLNPWLRAYQLPLSSIKKYTIRLPQ